MKTTKDTHQSRRNTLALNGFTLVELLSVLVLIAILTTFFIGRYTDLISQSQRQASQAALAEAYSRCSAAVSRLIFTNKAWPEGNEITAFLIDNNDEDLGDYTATYTFKDDSSEISIEIARKTTAGAAQTLLTGSWPYSPD